MAALSRREGAGIAHSGGMKMWEFSEMDSSAEEYIVQEVEKNFNHGLP